MSLERYYLNIRSYGLVFLGILICTGIAAVLVAMSEHNEITKLAATTTQDSNQRSTQPAKQDSNMGPVKQQQAVPQVNPVTQAAVKMGVLSCVSRINQVITFLTANTQNGIFIFPVSKQPDQHIFSTSMEILPQGGSTVYATASFFPNKDAVYDTVEYVNKGCDEMEKTVYKGLKRAGVIKKNIIILDGGATKIFLMPAGTGCVVIRKEVAQ